MRFGKDADATSDVKDLRTGGSTSGFGSGGLSLPTGVKGAGGIVGVIMVLVVAFLSKGGGGGGDLTDILSTGFPQASVAEGGQAGVTETAADEDLRLFVSQVFNDTQDVWDELFDGAQVDYRKATLVLFDTPVPSGCGGAQAAIGPHYCPPDDTVFIELGFFRELGTRFEAPGDFAQAYVIAHEMGHHVQNVLGVSDEVRRMQRNDPSRENEYSIRLELQADCYAGVWARSAYTRDMLDPGDIDEALAAAAAVGDDRIQMQATGRVDPESWNHGSSEQRQRWFDEGYDSGRAGDCDTFSGDI
ncbi:MAG: hypothetical protein GXY13_14680 [Acidimicrobiales bacterium]|nr:hypothetical protein [Acidimicrobiales bacterium]